MLQGGETLALARLADQLADEDWVVQFEKPKGDPSAWPKPATTVLSPYLKFGCLSARLFWAKLHQVRPCASWTGLPLLQYMWQFGAASMAG